MTKLPTIIWDWNGTLLDDLEVCRTTINQMLRARDLPELTREGYRQVFGFPVRDYYAAIGFDFDHEPWEGVAMEFIELYQQSLPTCVLAEGAKEALDHFHQRGYQQVIISAMQHDDLVESVEVRGIAGYLDAIIGLRNHYAASKVENAKRFFTERSLFGEQVTLIGDTLHDAEVAAELGCGCVLVANGHQAEERLSKTGHRVISSLKLLKI